MELLMKDICGNSHSVKSDAPKYLMNAFIDGTLSEYMTKNGHFDVFELLKDNTGDRCKITACSLLKSGCKEPLDNKNLSV